MKRTIAIALAIVLVSFVFVSCSSGAAGKYVVKSVNGEDASGLISEYGLSSLEEFMTVELKADGSATVSVMGESNTGNWKQEGDKIKITIEGDTEEFTLKGNELSVSMDGEDIVLVKK